MIVLNIVSLLLLLFFYNTVIRGELADEKKKSKMNVFIWCRIG